jgi:hypothetical protein
MELKLPTFQENNHLRKLVELADDSGGSSKALLGISQSNLPLDGRGNNFFHFSNF